MLHWGSVAGKQQHFVLNKTGVAMSIENAISLLYVSTAQLLCSQARRMTVWYFVYAYFGTGKARMCQAHSLGW